jgi:hypothetical protein
MKHSSFKKAIYFVLITYLLAATFHYLWDMKNRKFGKSSVSNEGAKSMGLSLSTVASMAKLALEFFLPILPIVPIMPIF